jgi:hypothetical protein
MTPASRRLPWGLAGLGLVLLALLGFGGAPPPAPLL